MSAGLRQGNVDAGHVLRLAVRAVADLVADFEADADVAVVNAATCGTQIAGTRSGLSVHGERRRPSGEHMNQGSDREQDMRPEYDIRGGVRGKYLERA